MIKSTPPNPHRFVLHLPEGSQAASLEDVLEVLSERYGEGSEEQTDEGLLATVFEDEDKSVRVFKDAGSGSLVAILTRPTAKIQMFFRPCSGWGGRATATGTATGSVLVIAVLLVAAQAEALLNYARLIAAIPNLCGAPCFMVPVGPYMSDTSVTVVRRFLGVPYWITVSVDMSAELICV